MEPIIEGTFTKILKQGSGRGKGARLDFPACTITRNTNSFICVVNKKAMELLDLTGPVAWFVTSDYCICLPSKSLNAYRPSYRSGKYLSYTFPKSLIDKKTVKQGHYRLYKYKSGFCFKHYKRLEDEA